jgi:hypothetical protein
MLKPPKAEEVAARIPLDGEADQGGECTVSRCGCDAGIVQEARKGNVLRWKQVPEDWCGISDREVQVPVIVN